jgi:hypothetical protein
MQSSRRIIIPRVQLDLGDHWHLTSLYQIWRAPLDRKDIRLERLGKRSGETDFARVYAAQKGSIHVERHDDDALLVSWIVQSCNVRLNMVKNVPDLLAVGKGDLC